jgi:hypothetical protein
MAQARISHVLFVLSCSKLLFIVNCIALFKHLSLNTKFKPTNLLLCLDMVLRRNRCASLRDSFVPTSVIATGKGAGKGKPDN